MSDPRNPYESAIADLVAKIDERMKPINKDKLLVNTLCQAAGLPPRYLDIESEGGGSMVFARDQFHAKPLATAVREYLERRGRSDRGGLGAASVNEIFSALSTGGYKPETDDEANAKRGLRIALTKNSSTFYRVPGGAYGLLEWYENAKPQVEDDAKPVKRRGRPPKKKQARRGRPPGAEKAKAPTEQPEESENVIDLKGFGGAAAPLKASGAG
jgi:hypothetical protein